MSRPLTPQELAEATGDYEAIGKAAPEPTHEPGFFERNLTVLCCLAVLAIWMAWAIAEWRLDHVR